ncbi:acyl-CoA carboxylase subunit epsilon [Cellulomonas sp. URHB0016]
MSDAHVQVVRGTPDDVELAALVAGLIAAGSEEDVRVDATPTVLSAWNDRGRAVRGGDATRPGPDAWRWSLRG